MLLLLEYYKNFRDNILHASPNVLEWTNMYKEEADKYVVFLNECTEDSEEHISNVVLYDAFKAWHKDKYPAERLLPNNREFINGINNKCTSGVKHIKI